MLADIPEYRSVGVVDRFAFGLVRVVGIGGVGMAIAAASYWIGTRTGGLPGFGTTMASLAVAGLTLGVVVALIVDNVAGEEQSVFRVAERPGSARRETPQLRRRRGICNQPRARFGATLLCPTCDQHPA